MNTAYDVIADRIIEMLDKGVVPWRKPWAGGAAGMPINGASRKQYRGINIFMLHAAGYSSPAWFTFRQAEELGAHVRKGEHGFPVVFWKLYDKSSNSESTGETETRRIPVLRYYTVFNAEQIDGLPADVARIPEPVANHNPIEAAEAIVAGMPNPPEIRTVGGRAYYMPSADLVSVPPLNMYPIAQEYYSTMFHELAHSTMHATRLNRITQKAAAFGSNDYGQEELLAEFGASFLCGVSGLTPAVVENQAAYISGWKDKIKADKKIVVMAAAQAQKAADYILGKLTQQPDEVEAGAQLATL
jgi:antirestriction protein ArdC